MAQIKDLTKGKTIVNGTTGAEYSILTSKPQTTGTGTAEEPNYLTMVRPAVGRAFDLIISQASLDSGAYALKS